MSDLSGSLDAASGQRPARSGPVAGWLQRALVRLTPARADGLVMAALNSVPHGMCVYDSDDRLVFVNEGFSRIYRQPRDTLPAGIRFLDVLKNSHAIGNYTGRSADEIWAERKAFIDQRQPGTFLQTLGDGRLIAITHQPLADGGWAAVYEDITERRRAETHLKFMAHHDALTMLPNRVLFGEQLAAELAGLGAGGHCSVLCLDLDGFKPVNDTRGHAAGDELLRQVAGRLRLALHADDVAARLGGDEFAVLLPDVGPDVALPRAMQLRSAIVQPYDLGSPPLIRIGVGIGVACAPEHAATAEDLLMRADTALYEAKRSRLGRPVVYQEWPERLAG